MSLWSSYMKIKQQKLNTKDWYLHTANGACSVLSFFQYSYMMLVAVTVSRMDVGSMNVWRTEQYFLAKFVFGKMVTKEKQQIKSKYK